MPFIKYLFISVLSLAIIQVNAQQSKDSADVQFLRNAILQTAKAINAHNPDGVLQYYSKDILVSYPNHPDTRYDTFNVRYRQMMNPAIITSTTPVIEEILVSGDLAIIRMIWETSITVKETQKTSHRKSRDLQVWKRENGQWKFFRGMWYHMRPA